MTKWEKVKQIFNEANQTLGDTGYKLVTPKEFVDITGSRLGKFDGRCALTKNLAKKVITVRRNRPIPTIRTAIYHELGHVIFPKKPHWWIECFGYRMAKVKGIGRYTKHTHHSIRSLPCREELIRLSQQEIQKMETGRVCKE